MAKNTQPIASVAALGISPAVMGCAKKNTTQLQWHCAEAVWYATQLKKKVKFIYGVLEKQFHNT
ncbi:MAG: hypothetical protein ACLVJ6_09370 [Merdibacter sp.]